MADTTSTIGAATGAAGRIDTGRTRLADSYETFMSLLTTQLKNQDPTSPLDTNQFTQQLVQMTGVEQQLLTNDLLKSLADASGGPGITAAVGYIGKTVTGAGDAAALSGGQASWGYALPHQAASVTLEVLDSSGQVVRRETGKTGAGDHSFAWNGVDASGGKAVEGVYTLRVTAKDVSGSAIRAALTTTGVVRSVEQTESGALLLLNGARLPLSAVTAVRETATTQATTNKDQPS